MAFNHSFLLSKKERFLILAVTIGSILEWHEVFLYVYWAPLIAEISFYAAIPVVNIINTFLLFLTAWFARPLGGIVFGYIGDRWGRKIAFLLSILLISLPSLLTWFVSSFVSWGIFTLIFFGLMRFLQGIPAGGETPGVICYFAESTHSVTRKIYICSYTFVGSQIGQLSSMLECLLLKKYLSAENLLQWGWKISFLIGGLLSIFGFFLRKKLQESPAFQRLKRRQIELKGPIKTCFQVYWKRILLCLGLSAFEVSGFFLLTIFPYEHFSELFHLTENQNIAINTSFLCFATILIPVMGYLGHFFKIKHLLVISSVILICLSLPLYHAMIQGQLTKALILTSVVLICFCLIFAFLPHMLAQLFPTEVRFTGIGFSFNVCDSLVVGAAPLLTHILSQIAGSSAFFILGIPLLGFLFLFSLYIFENPLLRKY